MSGTPGGEDRRAFLKRLAGTSAMLAGLGVVGGALHDPRKGDRWFRDVAQADAMTLPRFDVQTPVGAAKLAIVHGQAAETMVRAAIDAVGGIKAYVQPGDIVLLKPNVAFDRGPALGATTSPAVLQAVARLCREAGAKRILVADNPINQPEGCFHKSGLGPAALAVGCELVMPGANDFETLLVGRTRTKDGKLEGQPGEALDRWPLFATPFRQATKVIGVAPCKDHNLCGASMSMKNWYGLLGGRRNQFHQHIHEIISDFPLMIKPTLTVLDATRLLLRNGPTGGSLADVKPGNTIVAGADMVAVDAYGWTLLERRGAPPAYLAKAKARGLGENDWQSLNPKELTV
jgi:uncharacterized protein (DUF362 family)